jgi:catalase
MNGFRLAMPTASTLARLGVIGVVMLCVAGLFAYVGGWLSPGRLTQDRMMAAFEKAHGSHPGFRRNHEKGVCVSGWFESSGQVLALSTAAVFKPGRVPVIGRFSLAREMPFDVDTPTSVRSVALRFQPSGGDEWRTGMNDIPVFPVNSARGFYELLLASAPVPETGKPDPAKIKAFEGRHPEAARALALIRNRPISSGFANDAFHSLNAFRFVDAAGASVPVRWSILPTLPFATDSSGTAATRSKNYLFDDLSAQIARHPLQWRLMVTIGQAGDPTDDATLPWPAIRPRIDAGMVTIDSVSSEDGGQCTDISYDPLVLPSGIEPSDDPLLVARSAAYARSFTLRAGEANEKPPSAVTPEDIKAAEGK